MIISDPQHTGLLVSVRNASEALAALEGGANVIDVKDPERGSLGAADSATLAEVIDIVNSQAPVTAAVGELIDLDLANLAPMPDGVSYFKIGLAGCRKTSDWRSLWKRAIAALSGDRVSSMRAVAVAYADWQTARAPDPEAVLATAIELHCPALLIDTWDKSGGALFDHWPIGGLTAFLSQVKSRGLMTVLAGSLDGDSFHAAARLSPDLLAVRTAACEGGRQGMVTRERVQALKDIIESHEQYLIRGINKLNRQGR